MNDISGLVTRAQGIVASYAGCSPEQALVYACEDVVEGEIGSRVIASREVEAWIENVSHREDMDTPAVLVARLSRRTSASANDQEHSICIRGTSTTVATVLHELAHLSAGSDSHGVLWRDEYTRLSRAHISVTHSALLHSLFVAVGLEMSPWPASAFRR